MKRMWLKAVFLYVRTDMWNAMAFLNLTQSLLTAEEGISIEVFPLFSWP